MISQYLHHVWTDPFLFGCSAVMLVLFFIDLGGHFGKHIGFKNFRSLDFKTSIVSIGLFGTFYGVLMGLYGFNTSDINASVPLLLEGLKFAFGISVLGMFLSLSLSILEKFTGGLEDNTDVLRSIEQKIGGLITVIKSPAELVSQFTEMKSFLKMHLEKINKSLDTALQQLARGATEEVIQALDKIIREFNRNLQDQFGENFKELNKACLKMVEWQDKYRTQIEATEKRLVQVVTTLEKAEEIVRDLSEKSGKTQEVCEKVGGLIGTYDVQIKTLATHLESCKTLGEQAGKFLNNTERALTLSSDNLNSFSGLIETSVSKQSEALAQLTQNIDQQLPKALGELEKVLAGITNQFAGDYRSLFQYITDKK